MSRCALLAVVAGCGFTPTPLDAAMIVTPVDGPPRQEATLFVADFNANLVHRFHIAATGTPPTPASFTLLHALTPAILPQTGELLVGANQSATLFRYTDPLGSITPNGMITNTGLSLSFGKLALVDDELWVVNIATSNIDRLAFDGSGAASMAGAVMPLTNPRGLVFRAQTRDLYVSECCGTDTILHYAVAPDRSVTPRASLVGMGLTNPHGLAVSPWGEMFVAQAGANMVLRFRIDAAGSLVANGALVGNGLDVPIDVLFAPWGELFVTNQTGGLVSRFTFADDAEHTASANGMFAVPAQVSVSWAVID